MFPQVQVKWGREKIYLEIGLENPEKKPIRFYNENMRLQRNENIGIIQIPIEKSLKVVYSIPQTRIYKSPHIHGIVQALQYIVTVLN